MTAVYIVSIDCFYEGCRIHGVYSTQEKAEAIANAYNAVPERDFTTPYDEAIEYRYNRAIVEVFALDTVGNIKIQEVR